MILLLNTGKAKVSELSKRQCPCKFKGELPLALTATKVVLDIVDSVTGHGLALVILAVLKRSAEDLVVLLLANAVDNDGLLVIGDLEDDVLGLAMAHAEVVKLRDAVIGDRNSMGRMLIRRGDGGSLASFIVPRCELRNDIVSMIYRNSERGTHWVYAPT